MREIRDKLNDDNEIVIETNNIECINLAVTLIWNNFEANIIRRLAVSKTKLTDISIHYADIAAFRIQWPSAASLIALTRC